MRNYKIALFFTMYIRTIVKESIKIMKYASSKDKQWLYKCALHHITCSYPSYKR